MPGLMALRREYAEAQPLAGARIAGSLHMTVQTAVLIETLVALGADVRWASCNIFSTQDHAAAAVAVGRDGTVEAPAGVPVFAWKGETLPEYWWCTEQMLRWPDGAGPEHDPRRRRRRHAAGPQGRASTRRPASVPPTDDDDSEEYAVILDLLRAVAGRRPAVLDPDRAPASRASPRRPPPACTGCTRWPQAGELLFPAINVNDSVTKSKFDNKYGCRHSLIDGINRATDVLIGGKVAVVVRLRRRRQGLRRVAARPGRPGDRHRDRPDLRAAGRDGRLPGRPPSTTSSRPPTSSSPPPATRTSSRAEHMARMKHQAIVGNIGHFDNEIDMAGLARSRASSGSNIKPQVDEWRFADGHIDHRAVRGPAAEPRQRHRAPVAS